MKHRQQCTRNTRSTRSAFTLVELLVAMALTMFVMMILSQAFVTSLEVFSGLKAIGDMQANLRTVSTLLQDDLRMDHFEAMRRLSDPDIGVVKPRQGFFNVYQGSTLGTPTYLNEGFEAGLLPPPDLNSYRATNQALYFTVKSRGNQLQNVFSASIPAIGATANSSPLHPLNPVIRTNYFNQPSDSLYYEGGNVFKSQWAEISYFLVKTGTVDDPTNPLSTSGTPLHALYRAQYLLVPAPNGDNGANGPNQANLTPATTLIGAYPNVSCVPNAGNVLVFNSPDDVAFDPTVRADSRVLNFNTMPPNKKGEGVPGPGAAPSGSTLVLANVTSFHVQVLAGGPDFTDVAAFDSRAAGAAPIRALKVTIRIWDSTTKQSRQVTIIQDM